MEIKTAQKNHFRLERMFNGDRSEARLVSTHRKLDTAVRAAARWKAGNGWGVRIVDGEGLEIDLQSKMHQLVLK